MFDFEPGDVVCASGGVPFISPLILAVQRFWAADHSADYGHSFIILDEEGTTLDTLWTVQRTHIDRYKGQPIIIARPEMTLNNEPIGLVSKITALKAMELSDTGKIYPAHRILFHLIPPLARLLSTGSMEVCSERTADFLADIGARYGSSAGVNPDMLADEWVRWRNFRVLFQGEWPGMAAFP